MQIMIGRLSYKMIKFQFAQMQLGTNVGVVVSRT
jgi:hypothetical protein